MNWPYLKSYSNAVFLNLDLLHHLARFYGFPISVSRDKFKPPLSCDTSLKKKLHWLLSSGLAVGRTVLVIGTFFYSVHQNKRYFDPIFAPMHCMLVIGSSVTTLTTYFVDKRWIEFCSAWNFIWRYWAAVDEFKMEHLLLFVFVPGSYTILLLTNLLLAWHPHWPAQFQFVVYWAREEGHLTNGHFEAGLWAAAILLDFLSLIPLTVVTMSMLTSQMMFLQVWSAAIGRAVSRPLKRNCSAKTFERLWQRLQILVVSLRIFNFGNADAIFAFKVGVTSFSVLCLSAVALFQVGNWFLTFVILYAGVAGITSYTAIYYKAPSVAIQLEAVKRQLMRNGAAINSPAMQRNIVAMSTKGVWVGRIRTFERESIVLFLDFVLRTVIDIVLAFK